MGFQEEMDRESVFGWPPGLIEGRQKIYQLPAWMPWN
jgi:hypothetical protein